MIKKKNNNFEFSAKRNELIFQAYVESKFIVDVEIPKRNCSETTLKSVKLTHEKESEG